ncbi:DUF5983 family protein [Halomonas sp. 86]|uniref:DUF5983 family protein n=1 Tax=unclassified Halomonas TaxID=2609666 RepID=UPI004034D474
MMTLPSNSLSDFKCPSCGDHQAFEIVVTCRAVVYDDGVEETFEHEWDDNSLCVCKGCKFRGVVADYQGEDVSAKYCQKALLGETTHPMIGTVYALMRQAAIHRETVTALFISAQGIELRTEEEATLYPTPYVPEELVAKVVGEPTLHRKTFYFMPTGGLPVEEMVVASTGHLPMTEIDQIKQAFLTKEEWVIGARRDEGYLFYTQISECPLPRLREALEIAGNAGYPWVLFDADGEYLDALPIFPE